MFCATALIFLLISMYHSTRKVNIWLSSPNNLLTQHYFTFIDGSRRMARFDPFKFILTLFNIMHSFMVSANISHYSQISYAHHSLQSDEIEFKYANTDFTFWDSKSNAKLKLPIERNMLALLPNKYSLENLLALKTHHKWQHTTIYYVRNIPFHLLDAAEIHSNLSQRPIFCSIHTFAEMTLALFVRLIFMHTDRDRIVSLLSPTAS